MCPMLHLAFPSISLRCVPGGAPGGGGRSAKEVDVQAGCEGPVPAGAHL